MRHFAFYGRVSSDDAQDPSLSIPRQLAACERVVAANDGTIVSWYWDIESGRKSLHERGRGGTAWRDRVNVPCDGGLLDLIDAAHDGAPFSAVILESIDRLSRMTADATQIERDLERRDIGLFAADEPMATDATSILTRRVKQGVAEWYVRDLIERSRRGMEESVRQGWHTGGRPPFGYMLKEYTHPNPAKAREGKRKHRLVPDPERAPIVRLIFEDYAQRKLGLGELARKLNRDPQRYPTPSATPGAEVKRWGRSQLWSILRNPKYTGYNVWGRHDPRAGRPRMRPREQWVWSDAPTHQPLVSKDLFDEAQARSGQPRAAKEPRTSYPTRSTSRPGQSYILRGRVFCSICGRRMAGTRQKGTNYYRCHLRTPTNRSDAPHTHPPCLQIKEEQLIAALTSFLDRRLFGVDRVELLRRELATNADPTQPHEEMERIDSELIGVDHSLARQALRLEEHESTTHPVIVLAKQRIDELSRLRDKLLDTQENIERKLHAQPQATEIEETLDALPRLRGAATDLTSRELAEILEIFDATITYDKHAASVDISATLPPPQGTSPRTNDLPHNAVAGTNTPFAVSYRIEESDNLARFPMPAANRRQRANDTAATRPNA